ncbi:hypothetical protein D3C81_350350 [compost metagenome]
MPLNTTPLGQEVRPEPEAPKIFSDTYRHSIVESTWQPEMSLLSEVNGVPRLARYYRQRLNGDEEPKQFQPGATPTYQSYDRIDKLLLKQEGNGSYNFNPETGESSGTYNAYTIYQAAPVRHDVMVMDIGDGHAGLFAITEQPEIRNYTANKVYYLTYQLLGIMTKQLDEELETRTIERMVYSKDSILHGGAAVITTDEEQVGKELFGWSNTIANNILRRHFWSPENTIVFETKDGRDKVYDPYLVNFLNAMITPDQRTLYPPINQFSTQYGGLENGRWGTINVWEVLLRGDMNLLSQCTHEAAMIQTTRLVNTRLYGNLRSSKIKWFIATNPEDFKSYKAYLNMDGYPILMPGNEVGISYIFSKDFYEGRPTGEFENIVYSTLSTQIVDHKRLLAYCKTYFTLTTEEQLYHGAILLLLLKLSRRLGGFL